MLWLKMNRTGKLISILCLFIAFSTNASLLEDADGLNVSLFQDGSTSNALGPDSTTIGYIPGVTFGTTLPAPMEDSSEIRVTFFDTYIEIVQTLESGDFLDTQGWLLTIADIQWTDDELIAGASIGSSSYLSMLSTDFTDDSFSVRFAGGDRIVNDEVWLARVDIFTESVSVNAPSVFLFGFVIMLLMRKNTSFYHKSREQHK